MLAEPPRECSWRELMVSATYATAVTVSFPLVPQPKILMAVSESACPSRGPMLVGQQRVGHID